MEAAVMNASSLLRSQWAGYPRYHQSRSNLLQHIVFVPLFITSNIAVVIALIDRRWLLAFGAAALTGLSLAIQGRGHGKEPVPAEPFTGPGNAMARSLLAQ